MASRSFPALHLAGWQPTRDTVQQYAKVLGKVRRALTAPLPHWAHASLRVGINGLTTTVTPMPGTARGTFEIVMDFRGHKLVLSVDGKPRWQQALRGQSTAEFCEDLLVALGGVGLRPDIDRTLFGDTTPGTYDPLAVETYWNALSQVNAGFQRFKGQLEGQTGPVQLWPHHFDLAVLWFSGRKVPGVDPADEESADEQMNFGFSTGDPAIPEAYFYVTAYPWPQGLLDATLPRSAHWHTEGWNGAILPYAALVESDSASRKLTEFLRATHEAAARLMK